ncbi:MAG TPA: LytTR family DNA-binding domain-containing protein [Verrucomicrobiae bacterium]|jgi:two-component system LytT family response regulator|nr:LytTR family DNA-binding domain-containing protein [Verrucomicrobiae bacterium]
MIIRTLIVDDEPLARQLIRQLLRAEPDFEIIGECGDGAQAAACINEQAPDLVLLDIQMPERGGFEVLTAIDPARRPIVVFVTAYDKFALQAFEAHALDYLLKPVDEDRFHQTLERIKIHFDGRATSALQERLAAFMETLPHSAKTISRLAVKAEGRVLFLKVEEIDWIEAVGNYLGLHVGKEKYLLRGRLAELEKQLPAADFFRIHRSTIINLDRVKEFQPLFKGDGVVILRDGTRLDVSRNGSQKLRELLEPEL